MKDERLDDLIDQHLSGSLNDDERRELGHRLLHSAADRERFWQLAETHVLLHEGLQRGLAHAVDSSLCTGSAAPVPTFPGRSPRISWRQWRLLTAAAAGLALGVFCSSAAWAFVVPNYRNIVRHVLAVANAGFESGEAPLPNGVPVRYGVWSGDYAAVVGTEQGIVPKEGQRMFRFLRSDSLEPSSRGTILHGNIYQVVDVRHLRAVIATGTAAVDWSAWFNCVPEHSVKKTTLVASVWAFTGDTAILPRNWAEKLYQETAYSSWRITGDDDLHSWQRISCTMMVPTNADFLVVELKVIPADLSPVDGAVSFAGLYADEVQLVLRVDDRPQIVASGRTQPVSGLGLRESTSSPR